MSEYVVHWMDTWDYPREHYIMAGSEEEAISLFKHSIAHFTHFTPTIVRAEKVR